MTLSGRALPLFALLVFAGCATAYQSKGFTGGFSEVWQSERSVVVTFNGNGFTSAETVEQYATIRAAELALDRGFPYIRIANQQTEEEVTRTGPFGLGEKVRKSDAEYTAVMLTQEEARKLEIEGVPVVSARFYIEQNAPASVRKRILGE